MTRGSAAEELAGLLFSRTKPFGMLAVLTGYFDDSGTHEASKIVLMGGLIGNETQWKALELEWHDVLETALPGKPALKRFHMYECEHGEGEFERWNRAERDRLIYLLRQIIIENRLFGYACAIPRADWDDLVTGNVRAFLGDAEQYCVTSAILRTLEHAKALAPGDKVGFVFDNRPHREAANRRVFDIYQRAHGDGRDTPEPTRIAFESSFDTLPLQAADMFAWEINRYAHDWLTKRTLKQRPHLRDLAKGIDAQIQYASREQIKKIVDHLEKQPTLSQLAAYLDLPGDAGR